MLERGTEVAELALPTPPLLQVFTFYRPWTTYADFIGSGFTLTSSKGTCGVSSDTLSCGSGYSTVFGVSSASAYLLFKQLTDMM